ncbi:DUF5655 domain-containing protein [Paractinoplanes rishiriensis]|uniref:DUF5655 domain-containing protein n=1 Tax=Paractinoplanes rishiriensis TaxID=1050105 RepID=A0A919JSG4_9ACTN|nr:DUF5655 domain-containing protein [Actinoplanes rishiriensis]GIE94336.1 hypothetical protein Ari01nite_18010 [Actinoplanes rishiriensis]
MLVTTPDVDHVFLGRPVPLRLFRDVAAHLRTLGEVRTGVTRTQVSFAAKRQFAWVWLPTRWTTNRPEDSIVISFALARRVEHPRVVEATEARPGRWTHHVIVQRAADLGPEVRQWLREAYEQASA